MSLRGELAPRHEGSRALTIALSPAWALSQGWRDRCGDRIAWPAGACLQGGDRHQPRGHCRSRHQRRQRARVADGKLGLAFAGRDSEGQGESEGSRA